MSTDEIKELVRQVKVQADRIGRDVAAQDMIRLRLGLSTTEMLLSGRYRESGKGIAPKLQCLLTIWQLAEPKAS